MSENFLIYEGKRVYYTIAGDGPPLVLIHGYQADSTIWEYLIPLLTSKFTLVIPDLPGHGKSELIKPVNDMEFLAKILLRIVLSKGYKSVSLAGHSMGGYVAQAFANQNPNYVDNLLLINSHPFADTMKKALNREREGQFIQMGKKHLLLNTFVKSNFSSTYRCNQKTEIQKFTQLVLQQPEDGMLADLAGMMARPERTSLLQKLRCKIHVLLGTEDVNVPDHLYKDVEDNYEVQYLDGCGHISIWEKPVEVSKKVISFFKS